MSTFDVVLHTNGGLFAENAEQLRTSHPPIENRIHIEPGLWIGRLDGQLALTFMDVCEPKMLGVMTPTRQYAQMYAFVRELTGDANVYGWDEDHRLSGCVAMSRLVHPTTVGFRYSGRVRQSEKGLAIVPAQVHGISPDSYLSPNRTRDWLTKSEGELLAEVDAKAQTLSQPSFPRRVSNALWYFDYAQRTYYADLRWTMVATALEALIHTGRLNSTRQFKHRVPALAGDVGAPKMTTTESEAAYDLRSRLSHGDGFLSSMPKADIVLYDKLEETLRLAILTAFRDITFASIFMTEATIDAQWPVT